MLVAIDGGSGTQTLIYTFSDSSGLSTADLGNLFCSCQSADSDVVELQFTAPGSTGGYDVLQNIEIVKLNVGANTMMMLRIVGAGGYDSIEAASAAAGAGDIIYVTSEAEADYAGTLSGASASNLGLFIEGHASTPFVVTMGTGFQKLTLFGDADINVIGNTLDNTVIANAGTNIVYGMDGNDVLVGGAGDQLYVGAEPIDYWPSTAAPTCLAARATIT